MTFLKIYCYFCAVMRVLTLYNESFLHHCRQLELLASGFAPDFVVTIATGGDFVGNNIFNNLPHISLHCQRNTTKSKQKSSIFSHIVKHLPRCANNLLRIVESKWLASRKPGARTLTIGETERAALSRAERILVVDDAVDSGATLKTVVDAIKSVNKTAVVRSAAITVTTDTPLLMPDYTIYTNHTLIRFPWSADANS